MHDTVSLTALPIVPGIGTLEMGPVGGETGHTCSLALHGLSRPSGTVQSALQEPPPPPIPSTNIQLPSSILASSSVFASPSLPSFADTSNLRSLS